MDDDEARQFAAEIESVDPDTREDIFTEGIRVDPETIGEPDDLDVELTDGQKAEIQQRMEEATQRTEEILNDPDVIERGKLRVNSHAHLEVANQTVDMECPICGNGPDHLVWSCNDHDDLPVVEASEITRQQYQESINEGAEDEWREENDR